MSGARPLDGHVALVTGGSRGLGRAICEALARQGAAVAINYRNDRAAAEATLAAVRAAGSDGSLHAFDVADANAVDAGLKAVVAAHGGLQVLVNNAGIAINGLIMRFKDEDWARLMGINLTGAFYVARAAAPQILRAKERGRIINLASVVGEMGNIGQVAYAASKAGVIGLTKSLAREFASRGVTVNAVAPGFIETDMTQATLSPEARAKILSEIPMGRTGRPEEVAEIVSFLAGPAAGYITGQVLRVNGGLFM